MDSGIAPVPGGPLPAGGVTPRRQGDGSGRQGTFERDLRGGSGEDDPAPPAEASPADRRRTLPPPRPPVTRSDDGLVHLDVTV